MEASINQKTEIVKEDVLFHLNNIATNTSRLQLDYNRDTAIWFYSENVLKELRIANQLLQTNITPLVLDLKSQVNELFKKDSNLSTVIIKVVHPKRSFNKEATAYLNFEI